MELISPSLTIKKDGAVQMLESEKGTIFTRGLKLEPGISVAETIFMADSECRCHFHKSPIKEWLIVYEGELNILYESGDFNCKKKSIILKKGDFIILDPEILHKAFAKVDCKIIVITIPADENSPT